MFKRIIVFNFIFCGQKRKNKKDAMMNKKNRQDPNAPQFTRIPLPEV